MAKIDFGGVIEDVVTRDEFPLSRAREVLKNEIVAVIGYGVQGPAQALNMKDNGIKVIVGQAPEFKADWDKAVADGFIPGRTLFNVEEAAKKGTINNLVSDAAQRIHGPSLNPALKEMHLFSMDSQ
jgi:ketol-acid reductoisomerase